MMTTGKSEKLKQESKSVVRNRNLKNLSPLDKKDAEPQPTLVN